MSAYTELQALRHAARVGADALAGQHGIGPDHADATRHAVLLAEARAYGTALELVREHDPETTS